MSEIMLTQDEADELIKIEKYRENDDNYEYPSFGGKVIIPLISADKREAFLLDISRGRIDLRKGTYQNRAQQSIVLVRLDFGDVRHRNPDDEEIYGPHLHLYREGYGDKWAMPIPESYFTNINDLWQTLFDFMRFCNITKTPNIVRGLFT